MLWSWPRALGRAEQTAQVTRQALDPNGAPADGAAAIADHRYARRVSAMLPVPLTDPNLRIPSPYCSALAGWMRASGPHWSSASAHIGAVLQYKSPRPHTLECRYATLAARTGTWGASASWKRLKEGPTSKRKVIHQVLRSAGSCLPHKLARRLVYYVRTICILASPSMTSAWLLSV